MIKAEPGGTTAHGVPVQAAVCEPDAAILYAPEIEVEPSFNVTFVAVAASLFTKKNCHTYMVCTGSEAITVLSPDALKLIASRFDG